MKPDDIPFNKEILLFEYKDKHFVIQDKTETRLHKLNDVLANMPIIWTENTKQYIYKSKKHKRTVIIKDLYEQKHHVLLEIPELIFLSIINDNGHSTRIFAIKDNKFYRTLMLNVDSTIYTICWGDLKKKKFNNLKEIISCFWNSGFNYSMNGSQNKFIQLLETIQIENFILKKSDESN